MRKVPRIAGQTQPVQLCAKVEKQPTSLKRFAVDTIWLRGVPGLSFLSISKDRGSIMKDVADLSDSFPKNFQTTHWSIVLATRSVDSTRAGEALSELCRHYWYPLYAYIRRRGYNAHDSQDLTQEFFARLLAKDFLKAVHQERGRFRWFLLAALKRFLINERDREKAQKRGGDRHFVSLDGEMAEGRYQLQAAEATTPENLFDQSWGITLLEVAQKRLRNEYAANGREVLFEQLKVFLSGDRASVTYAEVGEALGLKESAVKVAVHRLRSRYRECLRQEIAQTVSTPAEVDEEIRELFALFDGAKSL